MDKKAVKQNFEIKKVTEESVVYQRVGKNYSKKTKNSKKTRKNITSLPTATLHTISIEEYEHLKCIEVELMNEIELKKPNQNFFKRAFISFFEL